MNIKKCEGDARKTEVLVELSECEEQKNEGRPGGEVGFRDVAVSSQDEDRGNFPNSHHNHRLRPVEIWLLAGTGLGAWHGVVTRALFQFESEGCCRRRVVSVNGHGEEVVVMTMPTLSFRKCGGYRILTSRDQSRHVMVVQSPSTTFTVLLSAFP